MKQFTAALLLVLGYSISDVQALNLKQKTFLVNGESVTMWISNNSVKNSQMAQLNDDDNEQDFDEQDEENDDENNEEQDEEMEADNEVEADADTEVSKDMEPSKRESLRKAYSAAADALGAQDAKNGALKTEIVGKLQHAKRIGARTKLAPPAPDVPAFIEHGIYKYKDADYAGRIEEEMYNHRIKATQRAIKDSRDKNTSF